MSKMPEKKEISGNREPFDIYLYHHRSSFVSFLYFVGSLTTSYQLRVQLFQKPGGENSYEDCNYKAKHGTDQDIFRPFTIF